MADDDEQKEYRVVSNVGIDTEIFTGKAANQAALKLARKLPEAESESEGKANAQEVTIRGVESGAEYTFEAWSWKENAGDDAEDWMPDEVRKADVNPIRLEAPEEWFSFPHKAEEWNANH